MFFPIKRISCTNVCSFMGYISTRYRAIFFSIYTAVLYFNNFLAYYTRSCNKFRSLSRSAFTRTISFLIGLDKVRFTIGTSVNTLGFNFR
jgi:hypothetical protein